MKAWETKIKDLPENNRSHLAWRLDNCTVCGMVTAIGIASLRYEWARDKTLFEIFKWANLTDRAAKIQSYKVVNFKDSNPLVKKPSFAKTE